MKQLLTIHSILLIALAALCGCASDEYLGSAADAADVERGQTISFCGAASKSSRANTLTGAQAAEKLNNTFVVFGSKTTGGTTQTVFDHYTVAYTPNTAMTTASNSADWEYVGQTVNAASTLTPGTDQTIKYWDFSADQYDFVAFAIGTATQQAVTGNPGDPGYPGTPTTGSVIVTPVDAGALTEQAYTVSGTADALSHIYFSDRVTALENTPATLSGRLVRYCDAVNFIFRPLASTVRLGLYETIPGYSVKNVKFYTTAGEPGTTPALFCSTATIPSGNTKAIVKFSSTTDPTSDAYNRALVTIEAEESQKATSQTFGTTLTYGAPEASETGGNIYLGRTSTDASLSAAATVLPAALDALNLKVDFTLVSIDYNETIDIKGASATVPAAFTQLQPNTSYTYLFKISDAVTDAFGQRLIYPVQFDALEITDDIGEQQTITTVDQPSVTTYAKGTLGNDYNVGDHIYIAVTNGTPRLLSDSNAKLYTTDSDITEKQLEEATIPSTALQLVPDGFMTFVDHIDALDSSSGDRVDAITGSNFAKFTAEANIYVFEFTAAEAVMYADAAEYNAANSASLNDSDFEALSEKERTKEPAEKHYKVIRVQSAPLAP